MKRGIRFYGGCVFGVVPTLLMGGCGGHEKPPGVGGTEQTTGQLEVGVSSDLSQHDVAAVRFRVVPSGVTCEGAPLAEETVALSGSPDLSPEPGHLFAQTLFVLAPGEYSVCMNPLTAAGAPSSACEAKSSAVTVTAGATSSLVLTSDCQGSPTGGIAVTGVLNDPPQIVDVHVDTTDANPCQQARIAVKAVDPNGDAPLFVTWSAQGPGPATLSGAEQAVFRTATAGDYQVKITVRDPHLAETSLTIPVHVSESALTGNECVVTPMADTYVRTDLDIRRNDNYGCNPLLEVGTSRGGGGIPWGGPDAMRILLGFPTILPPGATVESAVLEMTIAGYEEGGSSFPYTLDVHRILGPQQWPEGKGIETTGEKPLNCVWVDDAGLQSWSGGPAWVGAGDGGDPYNRTAPAFDPAVVSSTMVDPVVQGKGDVVRWDITALARGWHDHSIPNAGITITDVTSSGEFRGIRFGSREQLFGFPPELASVAPRLVLRLAR